jgi:NAD(P)H-hydrate epimerase
LLHAAAGDAAAHAGGERGLLPSDLLPHLRRFANPERFG